MNQAAEQSGLFGGGTLGTVLLIVGMVLSVAVVSGLGFIARMNDRTGPCAHARFARQGSMTPAYPWPGADAAGIGGLRVAASCAPRRGPLGPGRHRRRL